MELGALRCTARRPLCESCPVAGSCRARESIQEVLSATPRPPKKPGYRYDTESGCRLCICQRD